MSKARVVVLEVVSGHLTVIQAARVYGLSRQHLYRLLDRYRQGGLEAVDPRSRRPASNPRAVPDEVIVAVVTLRQQLVGDGLDAGPVTLQWHLAERGLPVPSTSTIRRILHHHGLITPQPRKRPKSSSRRFAADQPNECWQSDFTHWTLADGSGVEILNWLDDHSRFLLAATAYRHVGGPDVVASFTTTAAHYGLPASTLTDNGSVYTSRFTHGHNDFERLLASLGITQKNGHPRHPQTQGTIERFHQTLKRWLTPRSRRPPWSRPCRASGLVRGLACRLVMAPEPGPGWGGVGAPVRPGHRIGRVGPSYVRLLRRTGRLLPRRILPRLRLGFGKEPGPRQPDRVQ
jgi:transposase InsO family protein